MTARTSLCLVLCLGLAGTMAVISCAPVAPPETAVEPESRDKKVERISFAPPPQPADCRVRVEAALDHVRGRDLLTTNAFWTIFHGILGLGPDFVTLRDPDTGRKHNALDYICQGNEVRGCVFFPTAHGLDVSMREPLGVGQGHQDQFVAEMAQWNVSPERKFLVFGKEYTFMDFIRHSQMRARVNARQELSWTIVVVGQYLGTDIDWTNAHGEHLHFDDLLRSEIDAAVEHAPCGGTHMLFGLSWVYHLHKNRGKPMSPIWDEVVAKTNKYRELARRYQNADGSFSTNFFRERGDSADKHQRLYSTGHTFEWLALALPDSELRQPWMENAASALSLMILEQQSVPMESGALYHATHGLLIYHARRYDPETLKRLPIPLPPPEPAPVAGR